MARLFSRLSSDGYDRKTSPEVPLFVLLPFLTFLSGPALSRPPRLPLLQFPMLSDSSIWVCGCSLSAEHFAIAIFFIRLFRLRHGTFDAVRYLHLAAPNHTVGMDRSALIGIA